MLIAASRPLVTSNPLTFCDLQDGQRVSLTLTCTTVYNGTNLMPLELKWTSLDHPDLRWRTLLNGSSTVNMSSTFQSSLTFTTTVRNTMRNWACWANVSSPTGIVIPGVAKQYENRPKMWSSQIYPFMTIASAF